MKSSTYSTKLLKKTINAQDQIRDVAWMHYVAGLTQAQIATRRGLSRMKVHRLIQAAHDQGIVRIFVDQVSSDCVAMETELMARYGISSCSVAPDSSLPQTMDGTMTVVANAGALHLRGRLENTEPMVIGIGSGRTMSEVVRHLPAIKRHKAEFISVTGDFAALNAASPFEVINVLINKTGGIGYALTAPLIVDSEEDRELFLRQRGIRALNEKLATTNLIFVGIGHMGSGSFLRSFDLLQDFEMAELNCQGAVADLAGNILDIDGNFLHTAITRRMLKLDPELLRTRETVAVCSGLEKWRAARSALRSGCLDGLITTRSLAERVLAEH